MNLFPILFVGRWLHLSAAAILFGSTLFTMYAPAGRSLDRPLRLVVRVAAFVALASAFAETGIATAGLPRLALLIFACLIAVSLRRNSWTVRTQATVLAVVAGAVLASEPYAAATNGVWQRLIEAVELVAAGAWLGSLMPLLLVARHADGNTRADAMQRWFRLAVGAAAILAIIGARSAAGADTPPMLARIAPLALTVALASLAILDRFVLFSRLAGGGRATPVLVSLAFQILLAVAYFGSLAWLWAWPAPR